MTQLTGRVTAFPVAFMYALLLWPLHSHPSVSPCPHPWPSHAPFPLSYHTHYLIQPVSSTKPLLDPLCVSWPLSGHINDTYELEKLGSLDSSLWRTVSLSELHVDQPMYLHTDTYKLRESPLLCAHSKTLNKLDKGKRYDWIVLQLGENYYYHEELWYRFSNGGMETIWLSIMGACNTGCTIG